MKIGKSRYHEPNRKIEFQAGAIDYDASVDFVYGEFMSFPDG
jgi:hypothetical protein